MGDLDDLLSELDAIDRGEYGGSARANHSKGATQPSTDPLPRRSSYSDAGVSPGSKQPKDQLDDLLDELNSIDNKPTWRGAAQPQPRVAREGVTGTPASHSAPDKKHKSKCTAVLLGPADSSRGRFSGAGPAVCCDQLRCTRCDFKVLCFRDSEWFRDVDYMFFRNCYPDMDQLGGKLKRRPGSSCYACQCQWISCTELIKVDFSSDLRWVCGGHMHGQK
mmetsp:Transcript_21319/g.59224  ORF Transcript_21319/g.59224 Transcript_21319/m.59224 type:complete len:220 (+) Transcript_21319:298-957(+)